MRRRAFRIVVVGTLLGLLGFWVAHAQTAVDLVSVDQTGWWTQRPGAAPVGEGNIEVAHTVRGDESVAALRVLIRGEVTTATIVLAESSAPLGPAVPGKLRVCTTSQPWLKVDMGAWADAPDADCSHAVELTRATDANDVGSWTGNITSMLQGARSEVSLMVVPSKDQGTPLTSNWFMTLVPRIDADGTPDVPATTTTVTPPPPAVGNTGGSVTPPRVTAPTQSATTTPTTAAQVAAAPPNEEPKRFQVASSSKPSKEWGKLIFPLIPLSALLGFGYTYARRYFEDRTETT